MLGNLKKYLLKNVRELKKKPSIKKIVHEFITMFLNIFGDWKLFKTSKIWRKCSWINKMSMNSENISGIPLFLILIYCIYFNEIKNYLKRNKHIWWISWNSWIFPMSTKFFLNSCAFFEFHEYYLIFTNFFLIRWKIFQEINDFLLLRFMINIWYLWALF